MEKRNVFYYYSDCSEPVWLGWFLNVIESVVVYIEFSPFLDCWGMWWYDFVAPVLIASLDARWWLTFYIWFLYKNSWCLILECDISFRVWRFRVLVRVMVEIYKMVWWCWSTYSVFWMMNIKHALPSDLFVYLIFL